MKLCPACQTQYTDDTLQFCLQDGTPLTLARQADTPTAVLSETETRAALGGGRFQVPIKDASSGEQPLSYSAASPGKKGNTELTVMLTAIGMLILFGVAGLGAWVYFRNPQQQIVSNKTNVSVTPAGIASASPTPKPTKPSPTPESTSNTETTPAKVNDLEERSGVTRAINGWRTQAQALDIDAYMKYYAPTVDYYNRAGASSAYVRADKMRAFSRYSSIKVDISNMSFKVDPSGETVTVVMDKEWNFQGDGNSSGKVQQMMRFRRIDGEWLITAEKDLKLYYKN